MKMQAVRALAKARGVKIGSLSKIDAIRAIQTAEGNFDCYARAGEGYCDQRDCLFREECLRLSPPVARGR